MPLTAFLCDGCGGESVGQQVVHRGFLAGAGRVECFLHRAVDFGMKHVELFLRHAAFEQRSVQARQGVALGGFLQVVSVKFTPNATGMVAQEGDAGVHHEGALFCTGCVDGVGHGLVASLPIGAVDRQHFDAREGLGECGGVAEADFGAVRADVPFVVLHKPNHGQLLQCRHVERFGHFALGHRRVANAAKCHARRLVYGLHPGLTSVLHSLGVEPHVGQVLQAHGRSCRRDGLHACGRALVRDFGLVWSVKTWVAVIRPSPGERIVLLCEELKH